MDVFAAIAEPSRRLLLDQLVHGGRTAGELVDALPALSQPGVSKHLRVLREVGLVDVRHDAQRRVYTLRAERLAEVDVWLEHYRKMWSWHLDALEPRLAAKKKRKS